MAAGRYKWRVIGLIFKAICTAIIIAVLALLIWRIIDSKIDPKEIDGLTPNEKLCNAYQENGGKLTIFSQDQTIFTRAEHNSGYFAVTEAQFVKEAEQLQFTFRYNNSTIKYVQSDFELPYLPDRDEDLFDITVLIAYDLTPEITDDNDGNDPKSVRFERYYASEIISTQKTLYNYRKLTFDGIKIEEDVLAVYVDVYYRGDLNYEEEPYGALLLYDYVTKTEYSSLSRSEIKKIEAWIDENK